nr:cation transporting ATPase C-terminal domain-containing protein [Anoxybacter fermentans]
MNLVTDGLPALALGVDPGDKDVMKRLPVVRKRVFLVMVYRPKLLYREY